nr:unnamed protein product [Gossypium raimondii]
MAPYKALHGRKCRTLLCWIELVERRVLDPELVSKTEDKVRLIQDRLKVAFDRQKAYADLKRRDISTLWVTPIFSRILKRVGPVAYQLELPPDLDCIHDVFHVSMLRRYRSDPSHVVSVEEIKVRPDLTFEEEPVQILDRDIKVLRRNSIPLVKVLWQNHGTEEATYRNDEEKEKKEEKNEVKYCQGKRLDGLPTKMQWQFHENVDAALSPRHSQPIGHALDKST